MAWLSPFLSPSALTPNRTNPRWPPAPVTGMEAPTRARRTGELPQPQPGLREIKREHVNQKMLNQETSSLEKRELIEKQALIKKFWAHNPARGSWLVLACWRHLCIFQTSLSVTSCWQLEITLVGEFTPLPLTKATNLGLSSRSTVVHYTVPHNHRNLTRIPSQRAHVSLGLETCGSPALEVPQFLQS